MPRISVIVPARNEPYLTKTIEDVFLKSSGNIQVIAVLEGGDWPKGWDALSDKHSGKLVTIYHGQPLGMRGSINQAAAIAEGDYLCKLDAHVMLAEGWDEELANDCDKKTVMVPRRYRLDPEKWTVIEDGRPPVDYEYLTPPDGNGGGLKGKIWERRTVELEHELISETWLAQGSMWFMHRDYFRFLDLLDEANYGTFWKEMLEISAKAYLSGGRVVTNKRTWYAHWHKPKRGYTLLNEEQQKAQAYCMKWLTDESGWAKQTLPFASLIEKFHPPGWENWKGTLRNFQNIKTVPTTGECTSKAPSTNATLTA